MDDHFGPMLLEYLHQQPRRLKPPADLRETREGFEQREAIQLRYFAGLSAQEAAIAMGRQEGTVRGLQFRAIAALRRELGIEDPANGLPRVAGTTR